MQHPPMQRQYCSRKLTVVPERYEAPSPEATDQTATRRQKHSSLTPTEDIFSHESNTRDSLPNVEKPEGGQGAKQTMKPGHIAKEDYRKKNSSTYYRTYVRTYETTPRPTPTTTRNRHGSARGPPTPTGTALSTTCLSHQTAAAVTQCTYRLSTNLCASGRAL